MLLAAGLPSVASAQVYSAAATGPFGPIPDGAGSNVSGAPLVTTANIAGSGSIVDVSIDFGQGGLVHTWAGDLTLVLTHPNGTTSMDILLRPGRGSASTFGFSSDFVTAESYMFSDAGANLFDVAPPTIIPTGNYRATTNPNPPATNVLPYVYTPVSFASTFGGLDSAGVWSLEARDWAGGDTGFITGWTLTVSVPTPGSMALLEIGRASCRERV